MSERDVPARSVTASGFAVFLLLGVVIASYGPSIPHITHRFTLSLSVAGLIVTANFLGDTVSGFQINAGTGALLNTQNSPFRSNAQPTAVAAIPHNGQKK